MIQTHIIKRGKRSNFHQFFHTKDDEKLLATWRSDLDEIRRVFDVCFVFLRFCLTIVNFSVFRPNLR